MSMQLDMFPVMKERDFENKMNYELQMEEEKRNAFFDKVYKKVPRMPSKIEIIYVVCFSGAMGGLIWFLRCCGYLLEELFTCKTATYVLWNATFSSFITYSIIGILVCILIYWIYINKIKSMERRAKNEYNTEFVACEQRQQQIRNKYDALKANYNAEYEKKVKELSIKFANSISVENLADSIMPYFSQIIEETDRSSHIECIEVPLYFRVYLDRVEFSAYGGERVFSFEKNRINNLMGCYEQEAVARAASAEIVRQIEEKYPEENGIPVMCSYAINYTENISVNVGVIYKVWNSNYRNARGW